MSKRKYLLGIDIGTTNLCVLALEIDSGKTIAIESAPNNSHIKSDPSIAEQDPEIIFRNITDMITRLVNRKEINGNFPAAIGVTGQMHGVLLIDQNGELITPLISWQDKRGNFRSATDNVSYTDRLCILMEHHIEETGCIPSTGYGVVTLLRLLDEKYIPHNAKALTIQDYIVMKICGSAVIDPTNAASWGIFDTKHGNRWHSAVIEKLPEIAEVLPTIAQTGTLAGKSNKHISMMTNLPEGIPVSTAIGDNQASFLGSVSSLFETALLNLGTGGQLSIPIDEYKYLYPLETRPLVRGYRLLAGASLCGGYSYQLLADFFIEAGKRLFGCANISDIYNKMNELAFEANDDTDGLIANTLFNGTRTDPGVRGSITGISAENFKPGNVIKAIISGMVREPADFFKFIKPEAGHIKSITGSGNAIRMNPMLQQEIRTQLSMPVIIPDYAEEAARGAAITGGMAAEIYPDWDTALKSANTYRKSVENI